MTFTIDVDNIENNNFQLTENSDGDLVLEHKTSGATFDYDSTNDQWVASSGFSTPALETEDLDTDFAYQVRAAETIEDALNRAQTDGVGKVNVPSGTYNATTINQTVGLNGADPRNVIIQDEAGSDALLVETDSINVSNIELESDETDQDCLRITGPDAHFQGLRTRGDNRSIEIDSDRVLLTGSNLNGTDITLTSNSSDCVVSSNIGVATVTDNGSGNVVEGNS